ncbi:acyl-CoA thioesterase domain-containing protein [Alteromonas ponticola]|uniref:Acyl-CoA thioesterase II n=1 Tax=Alteromonas ponticola TaxID=2720613 RepID=A0ABX1QW07_9ALTE|nr:acyl-CoA thioesterase domain-containing protein [Alteromonas ponticola]NMH58442.1 acyl-CoA thioesterase II [Alteromonas ponticola]
MSEVKLASLFELEKIEKGLYRAESWDLGFRALFGGQVLGQALASAYQTVEPGRVAHSFHSYFLLPGDAKKPVVYDVEIVRDGRSFSARRVKAIQDGKNIFYMTASFQSPEEGATHQSAVMPEAPDVNTLQSDIEFYEANFDKIARPLREALSYHRPVDIRTVDAANAYKSARREPTRYIWMRARESLGSAISLHQAALAYASDYHFLSTSLQPHGISLLDKKLRIATIDHAMWFHGPVNFNEWLLYAMESPFSGNARGIVKGQIFNQQGQLVASTMQEGLMRMVGE